MEIQIENRMRKRGSYSELRIELSFWARGRLTKQPDDVVGPQKPKAGQAHAYPTCC